MKEGDFLIRLNDCPAGTLEEMIALPENEGAFSDDELRALRSLRPGDSIVINLGAGGLFKIERVREKRLYLDDPHPSG